MGSVYLINPPSHTLGPTNRRLTRVLYPPPPGGIAMVAACLQRAGHRVRVGDLVVSPRPAEVVAEQVARLGADAVGFSVIGPALQATRELATAIRARLPGVKLFAGNALPSEYPQWFLDAVPEMDAVVVGEGEVTAVELVDSGFARPVSGAVRRGEAPEDFRPRAQVQDLDSLPVPAWEVFPDRQYKASPQLLFGSKPTLGVIQSRGCPWSCGYCAQNFLWPSVRLRSIEHVVAEVKRNHVDLGIDRHGFYDSIFPLKRDYGEALYRELARQDLVGPMRFFCETRVDLVWEDTFRWLAKAGMHLVFLGIESPDEDLLRRQGKIKAMYDTRAAVDTLRRCGLRTYGLFVLGLPGEGQEERERLREMACSLPLDVASFGFYTAYAGSPDARAMTDVDPEDLTRTNFDGGGELVRVQRHLMRSFYLRPGLIARHVLRREIALDRLVHGAMTLLAR